MRFRKKRRNKPKLKKCKITKLTLKENLKNITTLLSNVVYLQNIYRCSPIYLLKEVVIKRLNFCGTLNPFPPSRTSKKKSAFFHQFLWYYGFVKKNTVSSTFAHRSSAPDLVVMSTKCRCWLHFL